jgi:VWFA-related protein
MTRRRSLAIPATVALIAALLTWTGSLRAQSAAPPTFRSGVSLVLVDIVVRDKKTGKLVTDLTKSDFEIEDEGKRQTIASFALVQLPSTRTAAEEADAGTTSSKGVKPAIARSTPTETNQSPEGRLIVFLLDDLDIPFTDTGRVRWLMHEYLDKYVADHDQIAIWSVSDSEPRQGFTSDRVRLGRIIDRLQGNLTNAAPSAGQAPSRIGIGTAAALSAIDGIADAMAQISGRRKLLVLVSGGWIKQILGRPEFSDTVRHADAANVAIYPIDPTGVPNFGDIVSRMSATRGRGSSLTGGTPNVIAVRAIAQETGGVSGNTNSFDRELARIEEDAGTYYMLGFTPSTIDTKPDHIRRLRIRVRRPGVVVQAKSAYSQAPAVEPIVPATASMKALTETALELRDLPLTAHADYRMSNDGDPSVLTTIAVNAPASALAGETLHYSVIAINQFGRTVASTDGSLGVPYAGTASAPRIVAPLTLSPGIATIKAAVRTDDGLAGSVFLNVDVPKPLP